ncbi:hypothetical protein [Paraburkholderia sp. RL17-337-BIB-A]|uniref:hypothetical protein n=1 Tax=Paraburkholderia sp. RL17-337-BIB-A TaxID=3031636 RepID=UPI0038BDCF71
MSKQLEKLANIDTGKLMEEQENVENLRDRLARAESERDAWRGKSEHHYKMACAFVDALRKQLVATESAQP